MRVRRLFCNFCRYVLYSKDERVHFTEQTKWVATQYPPAKYDNTNMKVVKPKHFAAHIGKPEPKPTSTWVIPKESSPGPGSYNVPEAMEKG